MVDLLVMESGQHQPLSQWGLLAQWNKVIQNSSFQAFFSHRSSWSPENHVNLENKTSGSYMHIAVLIHTPINDIQN